LDLSGVVGVIEKDRHGSRTTSEVMFRTNLQRIKTEREKEERHKAIIQVPSTNRK